jgi:hypothetical protein
MPNFADDLAPLDRLHRDIAALGLRQKFIRDALARHGTKTKPPAPAAQAAPPRVPEDEAGEGVNRTPTSPKSLPARGPVTEQVFDLAEGPATLLTPANLSEDSCTDLKLQLERFLWDARRRLGKAKEETAM